MRRPIRIQRSLIAGLLAVASVSACNPNRCVYKTRAVSTSGALAVPGGGRLVASRVTFREYTAEANTPSAISWEIATESAAVIPLAMSLRDGRDTTQALADMPVQQSAANGPISGSAATMATSDERNRAWGVLVTGSGVIVVRWPGGGVPGLLHLTVGATEDWNRPLCD